MKIHNFEEFTSIHRKHIINKENRNYIINIIHKINIERGLQFLNVTAKEAKAQYAKEYRRKNRERLNEYRKQWAQDHPEKVKQYQETYWTKKAAAQEGGEGA
jgi:hypothetical protein